MVWCRVVWCRLVSSGVAQQGVEGFRQWMLGWVGDTLVEKDGRGCACGCGCGCGCDGVSVMVWWTGNCLFFCKWLWHVGWEGEEGEREREKGKGEGEGKKGKRGALRWII